MHLDESEEKNTEMEDKREDLEKHGLDLIRNRNKRNGKCSNLIG